MPAPGGTEFPHSTASSFQFTIASIRKLIQPIPASPFREDHARYQQTFFKIPLPPATVVGFRHVTCCMETDRIILPNQGVPTFA